MAGWDLFPDELLLQVFSHLEDIDKINASRTCKQWWRVVHEPCLWTCKTFDFSGCHSDILTDHQDVTKYINTMGRYLQHLRIICPPEREDVATDLVSFITIILGVMSRNEESSLRTIEISNLHVDDHWSLNENLKRTVITSLAKLLEKQPSLQLVCLRHAFMAKPWSGATMESLLKSRSTATLQVLDIVNFYYFWIRQSARITDQLSRVVKTFHSLTEIRLNYPYLSKVKLETMSQALKDSLRLLVIYAYYPDDDMVKDDEVVTSDDWTHACQVCPRLRVDFNLKAWRSDPTGYLMPGMPLTRISAHMKYRRSEILWKVTNILLDHLAEHFAHSLEFANLTTDQQSSVVSTLSKESIDQFLFRCKNIQEICFSA